MAGNKRRYESMLFNYETTGRTDFRDGEITAPIDTVYKEKGQCMRIRPPPLKDVHTLVDWHVPNVPFNLYHKPKDVVRTNPTIVQKTFLTPEDEGHEKAQQTRPRYVMTPAIGLDDITDKRIKGLFCNAFRSIRDMLIRAVYRSTAQDAMEEGMALSHYKTVRAPFPGLPAPANPIVLKKLQPPYVSPEWRMESVGWDNRQLRTYCDPNREFWLRRTPKCTACDVTAEREAQRRMQQQLKRRS